MPCPTCDHTMHNVGTHDTARVFWCPRCGTVRFSAADTAPPHDHVPWLVERCQKFAKSALDADHDPKAVSEWDRLGITEAINKPEDRP